MLPCERASLTLAILLYFMFVLCSHSSTGLSVEFEQPYYPVVEGGSTMVNVVLSNQYTRAFLVRIVPERMGGESAKPFWATRV